MNPKEAERQEVGLTPEEVREINRPRFAQPRLKSKTPGRVANVLAASLIPRCLRSPDFPLKLQVGLKINIISKRLFEDFGPRP